MNEEKRKDGDITSLLQRWRKGDPRVEDRLLELVYNELKHISSAYLRSHHPREPMETAELVNEAYLRLVSARGAGPSWENRAHFFGIAAKLMRQVLVDHVRHRCAGKRGGGKMDYSLNTRADLPDGRSWKLLELEDALTELEKVYPRRAHLVELRYYTGLTIEETAKVMGISDRTVKREWKAARSWLNLYLLGSHKFGF